MSDSCRFAYNACLNRCPKASPNPAGDTIPPVMRDEVDVATCTQSCNDQARSCK